MFTQKMTQNDLNVPLNDPIWKNIIFTYFKDFLGLRKVVYFY